MKVKDLIKELSALDPNMEIAILDGFNAGGQPRALNYGPTVWDKETLEEMADFDDAPDYSDLESKPGTEIAVMGYGCY